MEPSTPAGGGSALSWVAYLACIAIGGFAIFIYNHQRSLIYPSNVPEGSRKQVSKPSEAGMADFDEVYIRSADGTRLHAYFIRPPTPSDISVLYCHANAGNMGHRLPVVRTLQERYKANVLIFSYRGYGLSEGEAEEKGMKQDAQAALDYLLTEKKPVKVLVFGQSIGGAVAIHLTATNPDKVHALAVENTFLSLPRLIPSVMPIFKYFTFLCTEIWASEKMIRQMPDSLPILFLSSAKDELIPPWHMKDLYDMAPVKHKRLASIPQGTHNDPIVYSEYWKYFDEFWLDHLRQK